MIVEKDKNAYLACSFIGAAQTSVVLTVTLNVDTKIVLTETVTGKTGIAMFAVSKINMNLNGKVVSITYVYYCLK